MRPPRPARTVRVLGVSIAGAEAEIVTVEARCEAADPMGSMGRKRLEVVLSGLPDAVLRESKNRLVSALDELGLGGRDRRLFLNLVPAGLRKSGEILDLPMALAAAAAFGHLAPRALQGTVFLGEVGIDGRLHAVPGGLAAADAARRAGLACIVGPAATAGEAACLPGIEAWRADNLAAVVAWAARGGSGLAP
ncbi:MAG: ATP-binding protein, partial [Planctomycetota bacterium]|nr:ATP-binding protein [Planctomycetota bacterium]